MKIKDKIEKEFKTLDDKSVVLLDLNAENYFEAVMHAVDFMLKKGRKGVFITVSRPYKYILREMQKRNIATENLLFIDCTSAMAGEHDGASCTYIENPAALEEIGMQIGSLLDAIKSEEKFLIVDSISALLIYNTAPSIKEFSMFLINKMRLEGVTGILVTIEKDVPEDIKRILIAMCDEVIYV